MHYLVEPQTVLPSQIDNCQPILANFGKDQISIRINGKGEKIIFKPPESTSIEAVKPFQGQYKEPIKKKTKTILQKIAFLNDTDKTDNADCIEKK